MIKGLVLIVVVVATLVLPVWADSAGSKPPAPPTLTGVGISGAPVFSNVVCNPTGTSSFEYAVTGSATGPYSGAYRETGRVTIGPQAVQQQLSLGFLGDLYWLTGYTATVDATFTIESTTGAVSGVKTLSVGASGACANAAELDSILGDFTINADLRAASGTLAYTASIRAGRKTFCDKGTSEMTVTRFSVGEPLSQTLVEPSFGGGFSSALGSPVPVHGHRGC